MQKCRQIFEPAYFGTMIRFSQEVIFEKSVQFRRLEFVSLIRRFANGEHIEGDKVCSG
jgi:hypothetical protein